MFTIGLITSTLYDAIPTYYKNTVVRLLNLTSHDSLRHYITTVTTHGGVVYQCNDDFILMMTEVDHRLISRLTKLMGEVPLTTFYRLNLDRLQLLLQAKAIYKSCFGLQVKHCAKVFTLLPMNVYYLMYPPSIIGSATNGDVLLRNEFKMISTPPQFIERRSRSKT